MNGNDHFNQHSTMKTQMIFLRRLTFSLVFAVSLLSPVFCSAADPALSSWLTAYSGQYARIYETDADRTSNTTLTTWPRNGRSVNMGSGGQTTPTYCGIHEVSYSASWVYLRTTGLGSH